jgi:hypothetical protein
MLRFMEVKQKGPSDWARYSKEWRNVVAELTRYANGNWQNIWNVFLTCHLLTSVDQEQFKEVLRPVFGRNDWGNHDQWLTDLSTYAINYERMAEVRAMSQQVKACSGKWW